MITPLIGTFCICEGFVGNRKYEHTDLRFKRHNSEWHVWSKQSAVQFVPITGKLTCGILGNLVRVENIINRRTNRSESKLPRADSFNFNP